MRQGLVHILAIPVWNGVRYPVACYNIMRHNTLRSSLRVTSLLSVTSLRSGRRRCRHVGRRCLGKRRVGDVRGSDVIAELLEVLRYDVEREGHVSLGAHARHCNDKIGRS